VSEARERAAEAWHQFLLSAVSDGAEPHDVFAWAYMAGWAHDKWPAVPDVVPPPDLAAAVTALPTAAQIRTWLRTAGWHPEPPGPAGTLWHPPGHAAPVAVPHGDEDTMTVAGAVRRVAQRMGLPVDEVTAEMRNLGEVTDG
jgi:hypothetical protein